VRQGRHGAEDVLRASDEEVLTLVTGEAAPASPLPRLLFIVSPRRADLYTKLKVAFAGEPKVEVHFDRRVRQRRAAGATAATDRRRAERRQREAIDAEVRDRGWAVVKVSADLYGRPRWADILRG
jgi:hypothetical protein